MMYVLYDVGVHLFVLASLPKVLYEMVRYGKYRKSFKARLGFGFPKIDKEGRSLVWIHAVSLGETKAMAPLVKRLKAMPNPPKVLLSTATETGHKEGKEAITEADYHCFLPLDFPYLMRPIMKRTKPDLVILAESDFWIHFQEEACKNGAKLVLVNGKVSATSFERLKKLPFLAKAFFRPFSHFCLQGSLYKDRFLQLGVPLQKIDVSGNIKLDREDPKPLFNRDDLHIAQTDLVLTLGSTHAPEEELFLQHFEKLQAEFPHLKIVIVPRHPERFPLVQKILQKRNIAYSVLSKDSGFISDTNVLLVDKMGVLRSFYSLSDVAFVGGSFLKSVGGHNILEPCPYGVPVIFGSEMHSQPDFLDMMRSYKAGKEISEKNLLETLKNLLNDPQLRQSMGEKGKKLSDENRGALENIWKQVSCLLINRDKE